MRRRKPRSITDVAEQHLCTGCGVCAFVQPDRISMVDDVDAGRRPVVRAEAGRSLPTVDALRACPGVSLRHESDPPGTVESLRAEWGPVLEIWEGWATDDEVRWSGSSGGIASALAIHGMHAEGMHGVLHIRSRPELPVLNETVLSTDRQQVLEATGSRYAPASPCDRLDLVRDAPQPSTFIGKPCDVAAAAKARRHDPELDRKLGLTVAIFCAGTPSTRGTLEMLAVMGIDDPSQVVDVRYRGNGWPGDAVVTARAEDGSLFTESLSYEDSWGAVLQRHRQWRCYVCADHTGEFADIAVGDPWYRDLAPGEAGQSLILVRTERGREVLDRALRDGCIVAKRVAAELVPASQPGLRRVRGAVAGRIATLRVLGLAAPRYRGLPTWPTWWRHLSLRDKVRSTFGTVRRVVRRGLHRRAPVDPDGWTVVDDHTDSPGGGEDRNGPPR